MTGLGGRYRCWRVAVGAPGGASPRLAAPTASPMSALYPPRFVERRLLAGQALRSARPAMLSRSPLCCGVSLRRRGTKGLWGDNRPLGGCGAVWLGGPRGRLLGGGLLEPGSSTRTGLGRGARAERGLLTVLQARCSRGPGPLRRLRAARRRHHVRSSSSATPKSWPTRKKAVRTGEPTARSTSTLLEAPSTLPTDHRRARGNSQAP